MASVTPWEFDAQVATDRICELQREDSFFYERVINSYLLFIWALWPTNFMGRSPIVGDGPSKLHNNHIRDTALCVGALISVSDLGFDDDGDFVISAERHQSSLSLSKQLQTDWFQRFDETFLSPLGGIAGQILAAKSGAARQEEILEAWNNTLLVRDVVRYYCCMVRFDRSRATAKNCKFALQRNIFERVDYRQRTKKKSLISDKTIETAWSKGLPTAVLLYAIEQSYPQLRELDLGKTSFTMSLGLKLSVRREQVRDVLLYYKRLMEILEPTIRKMPSLNRWKVLDITSAVTPAVAAKVDKQEVFSEQELANFARPDTEESSPKVSQ